MMAQQAHSVAYAGNIKVNKIGRGQGPGGSVGVGPPRIRDL